MTAVNSQTNTMTRRILTIDDNDAIHGDFRKILVQSATPSKLADSKAKLFGAKPAAAKSGRVNFEVDSALQGQEGLARVQQAVAEGRPYSVAFVDMRMPPGWDGLQTIQQLWAVDPDLQVVICSAFSDYSWDEISEKLGLTDRLLILKKPFDPAEVTQIATALSEKWSLRQAARLKMEELEQMVQKRTVELTQLAMHDKLTGLANRPHFLERLEAAVKKAQLTRGYKFALLFLDFDRFKVVNDTLGHDAGDAVLKGIADRLTAALKLAGPLVGNALAARLGGDEFTVLIDGENEVFDPAAFADTLLKLLSTPYQIEGHEVQCTASIGVTTNELGYERGDTALRDADTAMYHAKAAGKARFVFFDRRMHEEAIDKLEMENDLRRVLERKEISLHYQPIVSLVTGELEGFETLARWNHPTRGVVPPLQFIPCAEEVGLIVPLGAWIIEQACLQLRKWQTQYPHASNLTVSVNVSAKQVSAPGLVETVTQAIKNSGIDPRLLTLEITETATMTDPGEAIRVFTRIRELGVGLHLDDFGTGYSSLSSLHQFPLTGVKIDRSFVRNMSERRDYAAVVNAIISLTRHLGMKVIVEGIEEADEATLLQAMDCDAAQGYYFGRPAEAVTAGALIEKRAPLHRTAA